MTREWLPGAIQKAVILAFAALVGIGTMSLLEALMSRPEGKSCASCSSSDASRPG
jgi:hypothetical protein